MRNKLKSLALLGCLVAPLALSGCYYYDYDDHRRHRRHWDDRWDHRDWDHHDWDRRHWDHDGDWDHDDWHDGRRR